MYRVEANRRLAPCRSVMPEPVGDHELVFPLWEIISNWFDSVVVPRHGADFGSLRNS